MSAHAIFAPSAMARIVQCPGSVAMAAAYPETEGPEAAEGTAAHWVLQSMLDGTPAVGPVAPNGVPVDDDMIDAAQMALTVLADWQCEVERTVRIPWVHPTKCHGTPDAYGLVPPTARKLIRVVDFKYGHGFVDAHRNWQLAAYAAGVLHEIGVAEHEADTWIAELFIVQPRNYHRDGPIRTWTASGSELRPMWQQMRDACAEAERPDARTQAGPACKYCPARHACSTLQAAALDTCDTVGTAAPLELPVPAAARELRRLHKAAALLDARISGLETQLTDACKRGVPVPYYHLEPAQSREQWSVPVEQVKALGEAMCVKVTAEKLITPAQARKAGLVTDGFTQRPAGAMKLVPDGDKAAKVFGIDNSVK